MRVVWLDINASYSHCSLALPLLHRACSNVPAEWGVVRHRLDQDPHVAVGRIAALKPDVLAATLYVFTRRSVLNVLVRVKALRPSCLVVVGGPECLGDNHDLLSNPGVDIAVRGEGEVVLPALLQAFALGDDCSGIPGICMRDRTGGFLDGGRACSAEPFSDPEPISRDPFFDASRPFAQVETSRGCAGSCTFCTSCADRPVRLRPLADVNAELTHLHSRGVREFRLIDRTFNHDARRCLALLELFRVDFAECRFHLEIHPEHLDEQMVAAIASAPDRQLHLEVGVQSLGPDILKSVGREPLGAQGLEMVRRLCALPGVGVHVDLLAGLPKQTLDDVYGDVRMLSALNPDEIQLEVLKALPGTPFARTHRELGIVCSPVPPYEILQTAAMSVADLSLCRHLSRLLDDYYNEPSLRPALQSLLTCRTPFSVLVDWAAEATPETESRALRGRFADMHAFAAFCPAAQAQLRQGWMTRGFSPSHGICQAEPWKELVPQDACLESGDPQARGGRGMRVWRLTEGDVSHWFVYCRERSQHAPVSVWRR